mmetsp:Transcript_20681/g.36748  ORF Transcript_20681/g.36748 Transcript_20681/m.36748 type:complete len:229 (+) Transcript_20681:415-1101(+)
MFDGFLQNRRVSVGPFHEAFFLDVCFRDWIQNSCFIFCQFAHELCVHLLVHLIVLANVHEKLMHGGVEVLESRMRGVLDVVNDPMKLCIVIVLTKIRALKFCLNQLLRLLLCTLEVFHPFPEVRSGDPEAVIVFVEFFGLLEQRLPLPLERFDTASDAFSDIGARFLKHKHLLDSLTLAPVRVIPPRQHQAIQRHDKEQYCPDVVERVAIFRQSAKEHRQANRSQNHP